MSPPSPAPESWQGNPESERTYWILLAAAVFLASYSFFYTRWQLPPQIPFGTIGLIVGGDLLPMLVLPCLLLRFGVREPLRRYGWHWPGWRQTALAALCVWLVALPLVVLLASRPEFQAFYPSPAFPPAREHAVGLAFLWLLHHAPQLLALEFCHRGFLLFPLARRLGLAQAVVAAGAFYVILHADKPPLELALAALGGVAMMIAAWRTGSFLPAFLAHWAIAITMDTLCLWWARGSV